MSLNRFHVTVMMGCSLAVVVLMALRIALGLPATLAQSLTWLLLGTVPAVALVSVFRRTPPRTIGQVLYDAEHATGSNVGRPQGTHAARD